MVFKHTGDGICAAFSTVGEAAVTAVEAQSSLDLPVRMGLHVGAVELRDDDYYGTTVNVTARVASLGCAGQIVVSDAIAVMLGDADLVDLGVHQPCVVYRRRCGCFNLARGPSRHSATRGPNPGMCRSSWTSSSVEGPSSTNWSSPSGRTA